MATRTTFCTIPALFVFLSSGVLTLVAEIKEGESFTGTNGRAFPKNFCKNHGYTDARNDEPCSFQCTKYENGNLWYHVFKQKNNISCNSDAGLCWDSKCLLRDLVIQCSRVTEKLGSITAGGSNDCFLATCEDTKYQTMIEVYKLSNAPCSGKYGAAGICKNNQCAVNG